MQTREKFYNLTPIQDRLSVAIEIDRLLGWHYTRHFPAISAEAVLIANIPTPPLELLWAPLAN